MEFCVTIEVGSLISNRQYTNGSIDLKLPSLFASWLFWTFHNKSHNMKALVILNPFMITIFPTFLLIWKKMKCLCVALCSIFSRKKLSPDYICKSRDHDYRWTDLVMAWLPEDKRKCEHKVVRFVFVYILLGTCQWVHIALAMHRPDILLV